MSATEVHIWLVEVDDESAQEPALAMLPEPERERLGALLPTHRRLHICAQAALRILAAAATTGTPPLPELDRGWNGKPLLAVDPPVHVSLAHSGQLAAVALTTAGDVGVDIEELREVSDAGPLARSIMSPAELRQWLRTRESRREAALLRAWTRKEAVLKALGTGLSGDLRAVSSRLAACRGEEPVPIEALPAEAGAPGGWALHDLPGRYGYVGAVAVRARGILVRQHELKIGDLLAAAEPDRRVAGVGYSGYPGSSGRGVPSVRGGGLRAQAGPGSGGETGNGTGERNGTGLGPRRPPSRNGSSSSGTSLRDLWRWEEEPAAGPPAEPRRPSQLFCLPHAGGNAAHFRGWSRWLPEGIEVLPTDLPGHGIRLREPLIGEWQPLVDDLTATIAGRIEGPYVLAGHSFGAIAAYEVARALQNRCTPPALLIAAARNGPSAGLSHRPIHGLPDTEFINALRRLGGTPEGLLSQPDLLRMYLPVLRTDLRLGETYAREPGPPLSCPIMAFTGTQDRLTDDAGLLAWKRETTATCELVFVNGPHFMLTEREFTEAVAARLGRLRIPPFERPVRPLR